MVKDKAIAAMKTNSLSGPRFVESEECDECEVVLLHFDEAKKQWLLHIHGGCGFCIGYLLLRGDFVCSSVCTLQTTYPPSPIVCTFQNSGNLKENVTAINRLGVCSRDQ